MKQKTKNIIKPWLRNAVIWAERMEFRLVRAVEVIQFTVFDTILCMGICVLVAFIANDLGFGALAVFITSVWGFCVVLLASILMGLCVRTLAGRDEKGGSTAGHATAVGPLMNQLASIEDDPIWTLTRPRICENRQFGELNARLADLMEFERFIKKIELLMRDFVPDLVDPYGAPVITELPVFLSLTSKIQNLLSELEPIRRVE